MRSIFLRFLFSIVAVDVLGFFVRTELKTPIIEIEDQMIESRLIPRVTPLGEALLGVPQPDWHRVIATYQDRWSVPINILQRQDREVPEWIKTYLVVGDAPRIVIDSEYSMAYLRVEPIEFTVQAGPFTDVGWILRLHDLALLFVLIGGHALALLWLIRGLSTRIQVLDRAVNRIATESEMRPIMDRTPDLLGGVARHVDSVSRRVQKLLSERNQNIANQRDLLHAVAHELRSPLSRLSFAMEMMEGAKHQDDLSQLQRDMDVSLNELDELVREVLGYSRLQHSAVTLNYAKIELHQVAMSVIDKVAGINADIKFSCPNQGHQPAQIVGDYRLLHRALLNLVANATRFAHSTVEIDWHTGTDGKTVKLSVSDDGTGIPPGKRDRVFEPFTRLDPSRSRDSGGAGLGLAIVKSICYQHHGTVAVGDSQYGGALFVMTLPIERPDEPLRMAAEESPVAVQLMPLGE